MRRPIAASCAAAIVMLFVGTGWAGDTNEAALSAPHEVIGRIVNGNVTGDFASVGALLSSGNPSSAGLLCSGTLIGCQTFLTAGHCVATDLDPSHYTVFFQHAGFFSVAKVALHPDCNPRLECPIGDVAVLTLGTAVNGIRPTPIDTTAAPAAGLAGTIVGFGETSGSNQDAGIKRVDSVTTASCKNGASDTTSVCWNFNAPLGAPGSNSNTCYGDSGGPLLIDFGAGPRIAGVTSGGTSDTCLPVDNSYDANVFAYRSWIQGQAGADLANTTCGNLMQVGDAGTKVLAFTGLVSSAVPTATNSFQVMPATTMLRVTMNGVDDGFSDFDLFVKAGSQPSMSSFDCRQNGPGQFAACEFPTPAAGTWFVLVDQAQGSGTYQVTATTFSGGCADAANAGQPCDDHNACTANDRCQAGGCIGTPAVNGTPCDDGSPCTQSDSCQAGTCTGSATPRADCRAPFVTPSGLFRLQASTPGNPAPTDKLTWNWWRGSATQKDEFGNPLSSTNYDLCVFDAPAGASTLVMSEHVAAAAVCGTKPCWKATASGFRYTDTKLQNGAISSLLLRQGANGRARITLKGKGTGLGLPILPLSEPVTVQLSNGAACWEAHYSDSTVDYSLEYKAKAN